MASIVTKAIVLRRTNYGETDRILLLLTPLGQRTVMARGVRREKSKLAGGIELFALSDVVFTEGRGDMGTLTSARLVDFYHSVLNDYDRLEFAYKIINLIARTSRDIDDSIWFEIASDVLKSLDNDRISLRLIETWFYIHYSEAAGEQLNLATDVAGNILAPSKRYMYDYSDRSLRLAEQGDIAADHIKFMRLIAAKPISAIAQVGGIDDVLLTCWEVARQHAAVQ